MTRLYCHLATKPRAASRKSLRLSTSWHRMKWKEQDKFELHVCVCFFCVCGCFQGYTLPRWAAVTAVYIPPLRIVWICPNRQFTSSSSATQITTIISLTSRPETLPATQMSQPRTNKRRPRPYTHLCSPARAFFRANTTNNTQHHPCFHPLSASSPYHTTLFLRCCREAHANRRH